MIMNAGGREEKFLAEIEQAIQGENIHGIKCERKEVGVGMESGVRKMHDGLAVIFIGNISEGPLKGYEIFIGAHPYGKHLAVSWYFTRTPKAESDLTVFDLEELSAYASIIHHDVLDAVKKVMNELSQNFAGIDTKSKGILNIS